MNVCSNIIMDIPTHKVCTKCENMEFDGMHVDHIYPLAKGGSHSIDNLQGTHGLCNIRKRDKIAWGR